NRWWGCALLPRARGSDSFPSLFGSCGRPRSCNPLRGKDIDDGRSRRCRTGGGADRGARSGQGRSGGMCASASPHRPGRRMQELRGYGTTTAQLLEMVAWLRHWGVQRAVMESTSTYWKGVYYLLEAEGFECWLVNAREVKNVPGRAKTDRADAIWLAKVAERGMCRPSLVHPAEIRWLRDLTRYRRALVQDRTREQQRIEKLLEDAQIKISSVLSELHGVTARAMMDALIAGQRDPRALAQLAKGRARKKTAQLE